MVGSLTTDLYRTLHVLTTRSVGHMLHIQGATDLDGKPLSLEMLARNSLDPLQHENVVPLQRFKYSVSFRHLLLHLCIGKVD